MATQQQLTLAPVIQSLVASSSSSSPLPDSLLHSLALTLGTQTLLDALDLVDRDKVSRLSPPSGRPVYQVASSTGGTYTVIPDITVGGSAGGYCPCPAFVGGVLAEGAERVLCKHLLAVLLSLRLSSPSSSSHSSDPAPSFPPAAQPDFKHSLPPPSPTKPKPAPSSAFVEKRVGLEWLAGYATKFGAAEPRARGDGG
ncbi:hypothetical protein JCM8097_003850 [Rhodosporidiobolus ruineniae]